MILAVPSLDHDCGVSRDGAFHVQCIDAFRRDRSVISEHYWRVAGASEDASCANGGRIEVVQVQKFLFLLPEQEAIASALDRQCTQIIFALDDNIRSGDCMDFIIADPRYQLARLAVEIGADFDAILSRSFHCQSLAGMWLFPKLYQYNFGCFGTRGECIFSIENDQGIWRYIRLSGAAVSRSWLGPRLQCSNYLDIRLIGEFRRGKINADACHQSYAAQDERPFERKNVFENSVKQQDS